MRRGGEEWEKDGVKRTAYSVVAERVNFIGSKKKEAAQDGNDQSSDFDDAAFAQAAGIK